MNKLTLRLLLAAALTFAASGLMAQNGQTFTMVIKNIHVNDCGTDTTISKTITEILHMGEVKNVLIYENASYRFYTTIHLSRTDNRLKVEERSYITDKNNQFVTFGKSSKQVQFINIGMPGKFENTCGDYILIDKRNFTSLKVTFLRTVYYGPNQPVQ